MGAETFDLATRQKFVPMADIVKPAGGGTVNVQLPKVGLLSRVYLRITGSIAGTLTAPNALGKSSIIRRVRLTLNTGTQVIDISGPGYHYLLRPMLELEGDVNPQSDGRSAVATGAFNLDMVLPIAPNQRDALGLIMLQSEQLTATLSIEFEADATVATGATVTCTVSPWLETFTVPVNSADYPDLNVIHQILEEAVPIAAAGDYTYNWPRGNRYLQLIHGAGMGASGSDLWSRYSLRVNQSEYIVQGATPGFADIQRAYSTFAQRLAGTIPVDLVGSAGLGNYDKYRDTIDTSLLTDIATVITFTGATTHYALRRMLTAVG